MALPVHKVSDEQFAKLQDKVRNNEVPANDSNVLQVLRDYYETRLLTFAGRVFKEHTIEQGSDTVIPFCSFHKEIEDLLMDDELTRLALAAPRGHAKSTVAGLFFLAHQACYGKKKNIIIVSASEDMAIRFLRRIKGELEYNPFIKALFGNVKSPKWAETEIILNNGVTILARGRGAQIRGLIAGANRPDLILCDDLEDDELVRSEIRRSDLSSWFRGTVLPTLAPKIGKLVFIGTILHQDSLLNNLLQDGSGFTHRKYSALLDNDEPLWPEKFTKEFLHGIREQYARQHKLPEFFMEYMNDPTPEEAATFHLNDFQFFKDEDLPRPQDLTVEMAVDLGGGSTRSQADDTAFVVTATDKFNRLHVLDVWNDTIGTDIDRLLDQFFLLNSEHHPQTIIVEKTIATNFLIAALEREMLKRNTFLPLRYVNPPRGQGGGRKGNMSDAKFQRIAALAAPVRNGQILFRPSQHKLFTQAASFPRAKHDDMLDALSYIWMFGHRSIEATANPDDDEDNYVPLYAEIGI